MMRIKLVLLYVLLLLVSVGGCLAICQGFLPFLQEAEEPLDEEPYVFTELQELVEVEVPVEKEESADAESEIIYDLATLHSMNDDFVGWLTIPDTTISFPIVQAADNEFYLRRGFNKKYSSFGCPFLDTRTPVSGDNFVIHGHNIGNNRTEVFSPLLRFQNNEYALTHKLATFSVYGEENDRCFELFAVLNFDLNGDFDYFVSEFESPESFADYIQFLKERSLYKSEIVPTGDILILSTCNRTYGEDNRLLLCFSEV